MYTRYSVDVGGTVIEVAAQNTASDHSDAQRQIGRAGEADLDEEFVPTARGDPSRRRAE